MTAFGRQRLSPASLQKKTVAKIPAAEHGRLSLQLNRNIAFTDRRNRDVQVT